MDSACFLNVMLLATHKKLKTYHNKLTEDLQIITLKSNEDMNVTGNQVALFESLATRDKAVSLQP